MGKLDQTVICDNCRIPMNRHAKKVVDPRTADEASRMNPALGGVVETVYSCPECGEMTSRIAE